VLVAEGSEGAQERCRGGMVAALALYRLDVVTDAAPSVRPWNPPSKARIAGRPVARRASLSAPSTASEPEFRKKTVSSGSGSESATIEASRTTGSA